MIKDKQIVPIVISYQNRYSYQILQGNKNINGTIYGNPIARALRGFQRSRECHQFTKIISSHLSYSKTNNKTQYQDEKDCNLKAKPHGKQNQEPANNHSHSTYTQWIIDKTLIHPTKQKRPTSHTHWQQFNQKDQI